MASPIPRSHAFRQPVDAGLARTLLETAPVYLVLVALAAMISYFVLEAGLTILASLWLVCWPAWRLRLTEGKRWWVRVGLGTVRAFFVAGLLILFGGVYAALIFHPFFSLLQHGLVAVLVFGFLSVRTVVVMGAVVARRVQRRLRWQLMASHVGVIVLMVVTVTSTGSLIGLALIYRAIDSNPTGMAVSVSRYLSLAGPGAAFDSRKADTILRQVETKQLPLKGEPMLAGFAPSPPVPGWIGLLDLKGRVFAARGGDGLSSPVRTWRDVAGMDAVTWQELRAAAVAGRAVSAPVAGPGGATSGDALAEAPVRGAAERVRGLVVLQVGNAHPTSIRYVQGAIALFGLSTIVVIFLLSLPMLALSFLFAFVVARGLTRRLESVSQVATAIAAGDLSSRAPVMARNEIGRLAENINRMAAHLETTVGELQLARSQAVDALRTRQELVGNISHELRTPLAILRAHLETLPVHESVPAGTAPARRSEDIAVPETTVLALQQESARLEALVDDLFALSRAQAGRIEMHIQPVDVAAVVDEVAQVMRPLAAKEGMIALSVESSPGLPYALADADRLRQIISNLVRNAVRHTPEGGIIALSVTAQPEWVVIAVADTGEGIPAEHLSHIFDRFYRVDESRSRESGGAGLGLAIVKEFVELMGGQAGVESKPGEGAIFHVFLPISREHPIGS